MHVQSDPTAPPFSRTELVPAPTSGWPTNGGGELDAAMCKAESCGTGAYIEVVTDKFVAPPMAMKLHESVEALYQA